MRQPRMALALLLSFSELAWIASCFMALVYVSETQLLQDGLQATQARLTAAKSEAAQLGRELNQAKKRIADLEQELEEAKRWAATRENDLVREVDEWRRIAEREPGIRKEIVGLKGNLKRVVIVVDRSHSMLMRSRDISGGDRWAHARRVVQTWIQHLEMDECTLITFSTEASVFRADGKVFFRVGNDEEGQRNKKVLLEHLQNMTAEGRTNTLGALQEAYALESVDTILLFTDGEPNGSDSGNFDQKIAEDIYELCRKHPNIPVNTIGLGNYFDGELSGFLLNVAKITGGNFLGR